jgi:penicillin-binding protein A
VPDPSGGEGFDSSDNDHYDDHNNTADGQLDHDVTLLDYNHYRYRLMSKRIRWFGVAMIICFCGLLIQLDNIQGLKASQYQKASNNPIQIEAAYAEPRGTIISSDGKILATSVPTPNSSSYKYARVYPTGSLFAQIVGFTSYTFGTVSNLGVIGVENAYNSDLTYHTQAPQTLGDLLTTQQGTDSVVLTLSEKYQKLAQAALGNKDGAVVMLNPSNGAVLAMYSNPTFNPSPIASQSYNEEVAGWKEYNAKDANGFINGVPLSYDDGFFPGSTFKIITSAAAFDHDPSITTQSFPMLASWPPPDTDKVLHNADGVCGGLFTGPGMLAQSCDTGFAMAGLDIGAGFLTQEAASFGFWTQPPLDIPTSQYSVANMCNANTYISENACALDLEENLPGYFLAYSAIGQGSVVASPLEMAMVTSAIADDGVIMKPHVMSRILDRNDNVIDAYQPTQWLRATSAQTAASVTKMMQAVVSSPKGTAYGIFPSSWDVAAKTGTAQQGTGNTSTIDWMVAFAPANHPQVAIAVAVPDQAVSASGAQVSGPIVRELLSGILGSAG